MVTRSEVSAQNQLKSLHFTEVGPKFSPKPSSSQHLEQNIISYTSVGEHTILQSQLIFSKLFPHFLTVKRLSICSDTLCPLQPPLAEAAISSTPSYFRMPQTSFIFHVHCCFHIILNLHFFKKASPLAFQNSSHLPSLLQNFGIQLSFSHQIPVGCLGDSRPKCMPTQHLATRVFPPHFWCPAAFHLCHVLSSLYTLYSLY